ncbi:DUF5305 domain-containing protein [Halovenus rubra]|uniref:DUF5305 domain-containing protein n=2 Tax=Halovenus rubra TaxID=869890 RepID=A0ACC7DYB8_9EURY|nr:DUF5305 domain-containing protein [Halovenus rubra]
MDNDRLLVKHRVGKYFWIVVLLCVGIALVGGYFTVTTYTSSPTEIEQFEEASWSSTTSLSHQATVMKGTDLYEQGSVLRNQRSYFTQVMPITNGSLEYSYLATGGGNVDIETTVTLVLRSTAEEDGEAVTYWETQEQLKSVSHQSVEPSETITVPFGMNISALVDNAEQIDNQLGGSPGTTEVALVSELSVAGERNGKETSETYSYETRLDIGSSVYQYTDVGPFEESGQQLGQRVGESEYSPLRTTGGPLLALIGISGLVVVSISHYRETFEVSEQALAWAEYSNTYDEYSEWISEGRVTDDSIPSSTVEVASVKDLVDVAVDSDRRVIHDAERQECLVIDDGTAYVYSTPPEPQTDRPEEPLSTAESDESAASDDEATSQEAK